MRFSTTPISRRSSARAAWVLVAALIVAPLTACGGPQASEPVSNGPAEGSWEEVEAAAADEGKAVLYIAVPGLEDAITEGFAKAYPDIDLEIVRLATGDLLARVNHERDAGADGADVVLNGDTAWFQDNEDQFLPLGPSIDEYWSDSDQVFADGRYVTSDYLPSQLVVNTEALQASGAHAIESYDDLLQPELSDGLLGLAGPNISSGQAQYWAYLYEIHGEQYFRDLAALHPDIYDNSVTQLIQSLGAGSHAAGLFSYATLTEPLIADGAPIQTLVEEPTIVVSHKMAVPEWSHRPNAGLVLANWMLSREGQIAMFGAGGVASPMSADALGDVPDTMIKLPEDIKVTDGILTPEQQAFLDDVWRPLFNN